MTTQYVLPWSTWLFVPLFGRYVKAKLDTGADTSSIQIPAHILDELPQLKKVKIRNSNGIRRHVPQVAIEVAFPSPIGLRLIAANVADRSHLEHELLVGRSALQNILVASS